MTVIYLIRHGETLANRLGYIQGTLDTPLTSLTEEGIAASKASRNILADYQIECVFTSPLQRAVQTSQIICMNSHLTAIPDNRLTEVSYGTWNGKSLQYLKETYGSVVNVTWADLEPTAIEINHGETYRHACARINDFLLELRHNWPTDRVLIVTHGWIIKTMAELCSAERMQYDFLTPDNLSLTKITLSDGFTGPQVEFYNSLLRVGMNK